MKRFIEGESRTQSILLPASLDDYIGDTNPVRVVDIFVDELDLGKLGFDGVAPAATGRPSYHPAVLLKLYIYGYLNRIQSSRRLEREAHMLISIPPKYAVSQVVGFIKGKSAIHLARVYAERKRSFAGQHFWARGYFVSTVGRDEAVIREYIKHQEREDMRLDQMKLWS